MLLAQITDTHIVEPDRLLYGRVDTAAMLAAAVTHVNQLSPLPDVVLATGDLTNNGRPGQYLQLKSILADLVPPVLVIPGNHDDRAGLRVTFDLPGETEAAVNLVQDEWPLRLIGLDTSIPGEHGGRVVPDQMAWLDAALAEQPDRPTLIFQHHPPFLTGIEWMDDFGLDRSDLEAEVVSRHRQVVGVVCGHVHRVIVAPFANTVASTWPSTGAQVALALDGAEYGYCSEPPAVALHRWTEDAGLVSHVSFVDGPGRWLPPWALDLERESAAASS